MNSPLPFALPRTDRRLPSFAPEGAAVPPGHPPALSPREAAFAVAVVNRSRPAEGTLPGPGAAALAEAVRSASARDCLDAAFAAGLEERPAGLVRRLHERASVPPPFLDETAFRMIALYLAMPFVRDAAQLVPRAVADHAPVPGAVPVAGGGRLAWLLAPEPGWLPALAALSCVRPDLAARIGIATPATIAAAFPDRVPRAQKGRLVPLHAIPADQRAERSVTTAQVSAMSVLALAGAACAAAVPAATSFSAAAALNLALLGHAATRLAAAGHLAVPRRPATRQSRTDLPVYSVLVPLHREAGMARDLVSAMAALDYPADRLDVQFLVEEHDVETRAALLAEVGRLGARASVTVVPDGRPRTKPRALNVGLRRARGSLVTVFDAEDRPDPDQLLKAAAVFAAAPRELACVQASLVIDHADESWISRMFAIEYASLFDGILPMLADRGLFFLLGGTSNHFRREALVAVGGWDPHNVTEDADLAVRLARRGYRLGKLDSDTCEEAPITTGAWLKQRTRWLKGWMQTWLVHNRNPVRLVREMGPRDALVFHVLVIGSFLSMLALPFFLALVALYASGTLSAAPAPTLPALAIFALNVAVFLTGFGATFWLGALAMVRRGMRVPLAAVLTLPAYWLLMSVALALAARELVLRPHHWAKTAHGKARGRKLVPAPPRPASPGGAVRRRSAPARTRPCRR